MVETKTYSEETPNESFGINGDVQVGGRNFHIQTSFVLDTNQIICSVFDGGRLIVKKIKELHSTEPSENVNKEVELYHQEISACIQFLFAIADKIKAVQHPLSHNRLGLIFLKNNFFEEAIEQFELAIRIESDNAEFYLNLGNVYVAQGIYAKAVDQYKIGIEKGPEYADLHNYLGLVLSKQGKYLDSIEQFREAIQINKQYHEAYFNLGLILLESTERDLRDSRLPAPSDRLSEAAKRFRKAMQLSRLYNRKHIKQGLRYIEEKQSRNAFDEFLLARDNNIVDSAHDYENDFFLRFLFGGRDDEEQLVDEFVKKLIELIKQNPEFADLHNNLGVAYLIQGRNLLLRAMEEFRQALKINPQFAKADKNLRLVENDGRGFLILLRALLK